MEPTFIGRYCWALQNWHDKYCHGLEGALITTLKQGFPVLVMDFVMASLMGCRILRIES